MPRRALPARLRSKAASKNFAASSGSGTISAMWRILAMAPILLLTLSGQLAREYSLLQGADNNGSIRAAHRRLVAHEHALDILPRRAEQERGSLPRDAGDVWGQEKLLGRV